MDGAGMTTSMRVPVDELPQPGNRTERRLNELVRAFNGLLAAKDEVAAEHEAALTWLLGCEGLSLLTFRAGMEGLKQGRTIHALEPAGSVCGFAAGHQPSEWADGHEWAGVEDFLNLARTGEAPCCPRCLVKMARHFQVREELPEVVTAEADARRRITELVARHALQFTEPGNNSLRAPNGSKLTVFSVETPTEILARLRRWLTEEVYQAEPAQTWPTYWGAWLLPSMKPGNHCTFQAPDKMEGGQAIPALPTWLYPVVVYFYDKEKAETFIQKLSDLP